MREQHCDRPRPTIVLIEGILGDDLRIQLEAGLFPLQRERDVVAGHGQLVVRCTSLQRARRRIGVHAGNVHRADIRRRVEVRAVMRHAAQVNGKQRHDNGDDGAERIPALRFGHATQHLRGQGRPREPFRRLGAEERRCTALVPIAPPRSGAALGRRIRPGRISPRCTGAVRRACLRLANSLPVVAAVLVADARATRRAQGHAVRRRCCDGAALRLRSARAGPLAVVRLPSGAGLPAAAQLRPALRLPAGMRLATVLPGTVRRHTAQWSRRPALAAIPARRSARLRRLAAGSPFLVIRFSPSLPIRTVVFHECHPLLQICLFTMRARGLHRIILWHRST